MKIKSIHINNFGKLKDFTIDFESGFNIIYGNNEDGKSTIMAFIKMMFYGYSGKSPDLTKNIRKRYKPWDGSKMSGSIEFEHSGICYLVEKQFGASNATDKINLWNKSSGDKEKIASGSELGQRFFGIGSAAFEKSVFIGQMGNAAFFTTDKEDEITQKLLNLVSTGDESVSQKKVDNRLQSAKQELKSKSGKIGILDKQYQMLNSLCDDRTSALEQEENKKELERQCSQLNENKKVLDREYQKYKYKYNIQEELYRLQSLEKLIEKKENIEKLIQEFENKKLCLTKGGVHIDEKFIKNAEQQISNIQSLKELYDERSRNVRLIEEENGELSTKSSFTVPKELMEKIKSQEKERAEVKDSIALLKESIREKSEYEKQKSAYIKSKEMLSEQEDKKNKQKSAFDNVVAELDDLNKILIEKKADYENSKNQLELNKKQQDDANTQYQIAVHNLKSVDFISNEKIKIAEEQLKQASTTKQVVINEKAGREINKIMLSVSVLIAVISIVLGIILNPACFGLLAMSVLIGIFSISRKKTNSIVKNVVDEDEEKKARAITEDAKLLAVREKEEAEEAEEKSLGKLEEYKNKTEVLQKSVDKAKQLFKIAQDKISELDKEKNENEINIKYIIEKLESTKCELVENKNQLNEYMNGKTEKDFNSLNEQLETKTKYESKLKNEIQIQLKKLGCNTIDELQNKYIQSQNQQVKVSAKIENLSKAEAGQAESEDILRQSIQKFIEFVNQYEKVSVFEEAVSVINNVKNQIEELNTDKVKIQSQLEYLKEEMKGKSLQQIRQESRIIRDKIQSVNNGSIPEMLETEEVEKLKRCSLESFEKYQKTNENFIKMSADIKNLFAGKKNVSEVEIEIEKLKQEINENEKYYKCLDIAQSTMKEAFVEIRQSFGPMLNEKTASIFNSLTGGKYNNVIISRNFDIHVQDAQNAVSHEWQYLSSGTIDQAYLALRLAVSNLLSQEGESLPLMLDDVFLQYDDGRMSDGIKFLVNYANQGEFTQIILFTCHKNIIELIKEFKLKSVVKVIFNN